eukprot:TRINITY_DN6711_c0_g1_i1.p1 TRINITY_DN6711_c0_g1~~TRINITY_DN6711_c0_g1_i1.p1  ORF type:complete len:541 (+),score=141.28 TRINITY_DN6711_c0_g1_i1:41-1624(+)
MAAKDGTLSARGASLTSSRKLKHSLADAGKTNAAFLKLVERTEDAFTSQDDTAVEEVRRILADVRTQYDQVHLEAEKREAELTRLREQIRVVDRSHGSGTEASVKQEEMRVKIEKQLEDTLKAIHEAQTAQKVYTHMCGRISREEALLREKLLAMEGHLQRKTTESFAKVASQERNMRKADQEAKELELFEQDVEHERAVREEALSNMMSCLKAKMDAKERRARFDEWRHEVALDAANEAFAAAAGRLRKLYAVEKLAGNCLQKVTVEQVEKSQETEDGFQKIREVTGLADVMDIVHKFLNRDVEREQLLSSVKEAELRLDNLREQYERFKRNTDGMTFDTDPTAKSRTVYLEVEQFEGKLSQVMKEHEMSRQRIQQSTIQVEHMKRWANRMGRSLQMFDDCIRVDMASDLPVYFGQMQHAVNKFIAHIVQQISSGKVQRKNMSQVASKEYHEARRLLADKDFLRVNCRVPLEQGRPPSQQGNSGTAEEEDMDYEAERDRWKKESTDKANNATRKMEMLNKKKAGEK